MRLHFLALALWALTTAAATEPAHASPHRDVDIEFAAKTSFNFRMFLRGQVSVRLNHGIATLTGRVGDQTTRTLASETVALYPGVERIINNVVVRPLLNEFSDGWIAQHVHRRLLVKKDTNPDSVHISVRAGNVTLTGTAETAAQKEITSTYAREVVGVNAVFNQLVVTDQPADRRRWDGPIDDASITAQLRHAMRECPKVDAPTASVTARDGHIAITGTARTESERARITELAQQVRGSVSADNQMIVSAAP